jgi:hypothetical protein
MQNKRSNEYETVVNDKSKDFEHETDLIKWV